jgi:hypothetical protein
MDKRNLPADEKVLVIYPGVTWGQAQRVYTKYLERWDEIYRLMPDYSGKPIPPEASIEYKNLSSYYEIDKDVIQIYPTFRNFVIKLQAPNVEVEVLK